MSLVACELESAGLATVVIGSARDITEEVGVPRFLFVDFPLGNPCGVPGDTTMQARIVDQSLTLLERAFASRTTVQSPERWPRGDAWRGNYMRVDDTNRDALLAAGNARRASQERARARSVAPTSDELAASDPVG